MRELVRGICGLLVLLTVAGCQSTLPVRPASQSLEGAAAAQDPVNRTTAETTEDPNLVQVRFDVPLKLPMPDDQVKLVDFESTSLALSDFESIALEHNPTLRAAAARVDAAQGRQVQAGLYPNPVLGYHATEINNVDTAGQQGGFVSQRIVTAGKLKLDRAIAQREVNAAVHRFTAQEQRVLSDVRMRFYEALVAQRRVQLAEELVDIGNNLVNATQTLLKQRQGTQNDLLQAEIRAENARILADNSRNESIQAWRRLAAVAGVPNHAPVILTGPLYTKDDESPAPSDLYWEAGRERLLADHPELNAAQARVERAEIALVRAKREPIPNVDVSVSARRHTVTASNVANVQIGVPLPLFDRNQGRIQSARAELAAAREEVSRIELDLQERFAVAYRRYANARQQVRRYTNQIIPKARRSLDLVTNGYEMGQVEYLTMLTAQQTFIEASLAQLDAIQEYQVAAALIEGQLLSGSLATRQ